MLEAFRRMVLPAGTLCLLLLTLGAGAAERGFPLLTVYPPETHKSGPQMFDIAQDGRGVLHFGSLHGLATFDGAWWELQKLPNEQVALTVASDARGVIALGLIDDFGFLAPDSKGISSYRSLIGTLPAGERDIGDVLDICSTPGGFLFVARKGLLLWNGGAARKLARFEGEGTPRGCHSDAGGIFLRGPKGVERVDPKTFHRTPTGLVEHISVLLRSEDGRLLAVAREGGLFVLGQDGATPFAPLVGEWLQKKVATSASILHDGRMVITTRRHGLIVFGSGGEIEQIISADAGLPDAILNDSFVDREGSLWLAMEGPIVRVDLDSPVTVFDARRGVRGAAGDVVRLGNTLYAATTHGVYSIDGQSNARRIEPMDESWRLLAVDDALLIGTSKGIYQLRAGRPIELILKKDLELYDLFRSKVEPSRVWIAHGSGVASLRREGGAWSFEGEVAGVDQSVVSIVERDGVLWCGTVFEGILSITGPRTEKPLVRQHGTGEMNVFELGGRIVFVRASPSTPSGVGGAVVELDQNGRFIPDRLLGHLSAPRGFFLVAEDLQGNVWINSTPPQVFRRRSDGTFPPEGRPLVSVSATDIQNMRVTEDGAVWFASDRGLFRYDAPASGPVFAPQSSPLLRRVVGAEEQVLFSGGTPEATTPVLQPNFGRIRLEFAPASYRPGVEYQYRLEPIDEQWSHWTSQPSIDYTTLAANDYVFHLRARRAGSAPSDEILWSFTVLPAWYATRWAYGIWILAGLALVLAIIRLRTGALRRQAETLRARVAEQTAELHETVKLLESANSRLETLSLEDDLTGIANRRSFERALADEWNRARRTEQPLGLVLLDLDHFKDLNDRRGHPAGDDCLRRVGAFLSGMIRRSGEVVSRYGGEEFAILLPGVDGAGAIRVAETLREGIERLAIPYSNTAARIVTASCGAASIVPAPEATPDTLVASADRALYAAKHSGRNCVRIADERTTGSWLRDLSA